MTNLLKKAQLLQFMILIIFYILSITNKNNESYEYNESNEEILYKNTEYYNFLKTIISYNQITNKYIKFMKKINLFVLRQIIII